MLLFEEMKVKLGLIFSRSTGKLIGFVELGKFLTSFLFFALYFLSHVKYVCIITCCHCYSVAQARIWADCILFLLHFNCYNFIVPLLNSK